MFLTTPLVLRSQGLSLILLILAIVCFLLVSFGVPAKLGFDLGWLGMAFFAGSFIL